MTFLILSLNSCPGSAQFFRRIDSKENTVVHIGVNLILTQCARIEGELINKPRLGIEYLPSLSLPEDNGACWCREDRDFSTPSFFANHFAIKIGFLKLCRHMCRQYAPTF